MPKIILTCSLAQKGIFFSGELFECKITIKCQEEERDEREWNQPNPNPNPNPDEPSDTPNSKLEIITSKNEKYSEIDFGWAQISANFSLDGNLVKKLDFNRLNEKVLYGCSGGSVGSATATSSTAKSTPTIIYGGGILSSAPTIHNESSSPSSTFPKSLLQDPLPLYSTPPSILFCDLALRPGESRTYKYEILLPSALPPSYPKGRCLRIVYDLAVGLQVPTTMKMRETRVFNVPFRLFNRTNVDGSRAVFELLNPVIHSKDKAVVTLIPISNPKTQTPRSSISIPRPLEDPRRVSRASVTSSRPILESDYETQSLDNVANILQLSGKVSYDICKNNEHIAQIVLGRLSYRLGESVTFVLNFTKSSIPCFHVSAFLESVELVEPIYAVKPREIVRQNTLHVLAEYHAYTINSRRTCVALSIPESATPDFATSAVSLCYTMRFEFITSMSGGALHYGGAVGGIDHLKGVEKVDVEAFDCTIPLKVYGALKSGKGNGRKNVEFSLNAER